MKEEHTDWEESKTETTQESKSLPKRVEELLQRKGVMQRIIKTIKDMNNNLPTSMDLTEKSKILIENALKTITQADIDIIRDEIDQSNTIIQ